MCGRLKIYYDSWNEKKYQIFTELQKLRPQCTHTCAHPASRTFFVEYSTKFSPFFQAHGHENDWISERTVYYILKTLREITSRMGLISKHPLLLNVIQAEFTLQSLLFLKKKNRQEKITNAIVKFPSLYCTNRVNLSDHNWLCYKTDLKNFNPLVYVQVPLAEKYRRYWITKLTKSHISNI